MNDTLQIKGRLEVRHFDRPDGLGVELCNETYLQTITTVGKQWVADVLQEVDAATDALKWHKSGTGTTAAVVGNTNLATGIYSRTSGSQTEGASANIYRSVGTINYTGTRSITEWGIFTTSTGGSMVSRKTFTAKSVVNGHSIQFTWDLTIG